MRLAWMGWAAAGLLACGGNTFTTGGDASSPASHDAAGDLDAAGANDAGPDAEGDAGLAPVETDAGLPCGAGTTCSGTTPACCVSVAGGTYGCAHDTCGCATQLDCRRKDDCPGAQVCCITPAPTSATCSDAHSVAQCRDATACPVAGSYVLCEPTLGGCGGVLVCRQDTATLTKLGLPLPPANFGVCGP